MNRSVTTERLYSLGDYKNIKITDTVTDIPEELAINQDFMNELKILQLIQVELGYRNYHKLVAEHPYDENIDIAIKEFEKMRDGTTKKLTEIMKTKNGG